MKRKKLKLVGTANLFETGTKSQRYLVAATTLFSTRTTRQNGGAVVLTYPLRNSYSLYICVQ